MEKKKILHIITGLYDGGAEGVLYRLCQGSDSFEHVVISMIDEGKYGSLLENLGVQCFYLRMNKNRLNFFSFFTLIKIIKEINPWAVQTWMYHADFLGGLAAKLSGVKKIYWNVRNSSIDKKTTKYSIQIILKALTLLSYVLPTKIVCCAHSAKNEHFNIGYASKKLVVIHNGYNLNTLGMIGKSGFRKNNKIDEKITLVGMVARVDPNKDHSCFIEAASIVLKEFPVNFLLVGKGANLDNSKLKKEIEKYGLCDNIYLVGTQADIPNVMRALDVHVISSSYGEGFPNVIAEAMGCGTPCVATKVGESALIIENLGWIVPPKNPKALADAIAKAIYEKENDKDKWLVRKKKCENSIFRRFSLEKMCLEYEKIWS